MFEQYLFNISEYFLPAVINDDWTGLSDEETSQLEVFLGVTYCEHAMQGGHSLPAHWSVEDDEPFFTRCEVTGLMSMCVVAGLYVREQAA